MGKITFAAVLVFSLINSAKADINDVISSTCMINKHCTGFVYNEDKDKYYIMSAGHCTCKETHYVRFFHSGKMSEKINATIVVKKYNDAPVGEVKGEEPTPEQLQIIEEDVSVISILKKDILNYPLPKILTVAKPDFKINKDDVILTNGCSQGNWPTLCKGTISITRENFFKFEPMPLGGRSGSLITNADGTKVIGIVVRATPERQGIALNNKRIYELMNWKP